MRKGPSWFNITALALGLAFLYVPIAILVIYSFNASRLVTVWGGWSTRWYVALMNDAAMLDAAWVTLRLGRRRDRARHARRACAHSLRPFSRAAPVRRHYLRATGDAGSDHRPLAAAFVRGGRCRSRVLDHHRRTHDPDHVLRRYHRAGTAC